MCAACTALYVLNPLGPNICIQILPTDLYLLQLLLLQLISTY